MNKGLIRITVRTLAWRKLNTLLIARCPYLIILVVHFNKSGYWKPFRTFFRSAFSTYLETYQGFCLIDSLDKPVFGVSRAVRRGEQGLKHD